MSGDGPEPRARISDRVLDSVSEALKAEGIDGWLLFDLEGRNAVAAELLGMPEGTHRRHFVLLRPDRPPAAVVHRIERQAWEAWEGELEEYVGWEELESRLRGLLEHCDWVAMEVSERDAVPAVDQVPAGVVQLVEACGVRVVGSANLISRTYARWGERGLELHEEAGEALARTARKAFRRASEAAAGDGPLREAELRRWILETLSEAGLEEVDAIVGAGPNSALPHYTPPAEGSPRIESGDVLLVDLWGRTAGSAEAVFADQTWMGTMGPEGPDGFAEAWDAVRAARDRAVAYVAERHAEGELPTGAEVDRETRSVLESHGFGDRILHRTGHGIDRALHGFGPNLDSVETRDERPLVEGVGFSVEPGLYWEGRWGIRSEINVYVGGDGPVVTTPGVQDEPWYLEGS